MNFKYINNKVTIEIAVFSLFFIWQINNIPVPIWDGSDYIISALNIVDYFKNNDLYQSIKYLFRERGWRPLNLTAISFPVFYIFNKQINLSLALIIGVQGLLFYRAIFTFLKTAGLGERVFIPCIILSVPWIFNRSHDYFADAILMIAGLYFASSVINLKNEESSLNSIVLIISGFLFYTSRPAEAIIYTSIVLFYLMVMYSMIRIQLIKFALFSIILLIALIYQPFIQQFGFVKINAVPFICYFIALSLFINSVIKKEYSNLKLFITIFIVFIWFYSKKYELFDWVYTTSFGDLAKTTDQRSSNSSIITIFNNIFSTYNIQLFYILSGLSLLFIFYRFSKDILLISFFSILIMLVAYYITGTGDHRRVMLPVFIIYVYSIGLISFKSKICNYLIYWMGSLLIFQSIYASVFVGTNFNGIPLISISSHASPSKVDDPNLEMARILKPLLNEPGTVAYYSYCYFDGVSECSNRGIKWAENQATNARLLEINGKNKIHFKNDIDFTLSISSQLIKGGYHYVLLDSFNAPARIDTNIQNMNATFNLIDTLLILKKNPDGFKLIHEFSLWGRKFYLYKIT